MIWADDQISLPNNSFPAIFQLKSLKRRLGKDPVLKEQYSTTICDDLQKHTLSKSKSPFPLGPTNPVSGTYHTTQYFTRSKARRVLRGAAKFHGHSLNNALVTGPDLLQN